MWLIRNCIFVVLKPLQFIIMLILWKIFKIPEKMTNPASCNSILLWFTAMSQKSVSSKKRNISSAHEFASWISFDLTKAHHLHQPLKGLRFSSAFSWYFQKQSCAASFSSILMISSAAASQSRWLSSPRWRVVGGAKNSHHSSLSATLLGLADYHCHELKEKSKLYWRKGVETITK